MLYLNYHMHSDYSNFMTPDTPVKFEDHCKRAVELGHEFIFTTEHGYMGDFHVKYDLAQKYNLKLIGGCEFYFAPNRFEKVKTRETMMHMVIIAKKKDGYKELNRLISESNITGYYYHPRIDLELLRSLNPDDFYITTACIGGLLNNIEMVEEIHKIFGKNLMIEIQSHNHPLQIEFNRKGLEVAKRLRLRLIHANDSHYVYPEQAVLRNEYLLGKEMTYGEEDSFVLDYPSGEEVFRRYRAQGIPEFTDKIVEHALQSTWLFAKCEPMELSKEIKMPTLYPGKTHEEKIKILKNLLNEKWKEERKHIPKERWKEYEEAMKFEMDIIETTKMEDYFLLNYEIIRKAVHEYDGILTRTGRGSGPSFYLNKLLGFTEIDRLAEETVLFPTRFMSKSRILETKSLPDKKVI